MSDAVVEALGGAIGSCIAYGVTYPLTTVSTWQALQQNQGEEGQETDRLKLVLTYLPSPIKELVIHSKTKGWAALFAGIKPYLVATAVSQGLYFYLYSAIRQTVVAIKAREGSKLEPSRTQDIGVLGSIVVASLAGSLNVAATLPIWLVALRQQAARCKPSDHPDAQRSAIDLAKEVYRQDGLKGFWKGLAPSLIMVLNPTIQYMLYEWLTARLLAVRRKQQAVSAKRSPVSLTARDAFVMSALAKLGATLATYPMNVIKSRMQASNANSSADEQYNHVSEAVLRIIRTEGMAGLFKGMKAKMLQTVLGAALLMSIKEQVYNSIRSLQLKSAREQLVVLAVVTR